MSSVEDEPGRAQKTKKKKEKKKQKEERRKQKAERRERTEMENTGARKERMST
jgi:hypothetical protein